MSKSTIKRISGEDTIKMLIENIIGQSENKEDYECNCENCDDKEMCDAINNIMNYDESESEEEYEEVSLKDFLSSIINRIEKASMNEEDEDFENDGYHDDSYDDEYCDNKKESSSFFNMVNEFNAGYTGTFVSENNDIVKYDNGSKTLLIVTKNATFPAPIDSEFLSLEFTKNTVQISNSEALRLAIRGEKANFTVDMFGTEVTGFITSKDGIPGFAVENPIPGMRIETVIIMALFNGIWTME